MQKSVDTKKKKKNGGRINAKKYTFTAKQWGVDEAYVTILWSGGLNRLLSKVQAAVTFRESIVLCF